MMHFVTKVHTHPNDVSFVWEIDMYLCACVCVCVCVPPRLLLTRGKKRHKVDHISLVKQVLQL